MIFSWDKNGNYRTIDIHDPIKECEEDILITFYNHGIIKSSLDGFRTIRNRFESTNALLN